MAMTWRVTGILTNKWVVGLMADSPANPKPTVLIFEFDDRENINLAILPDEAVKIARAILDQYENPPPPPDRYS
ncbi:hypothetical protein ACVIW2_001459 [Bradyrhizobium huanghuaihaiense]